MRIMNLEEIYLEGKRLEACFFDFSKIRVTMAPTAFTLPTLAL